MIPNKPNFQGKTHDCLTVIYAYYWPDKLQIDSVLGELGHNFIVFTLPEYAHAFRSLNKNLIVLVSNDRPEEDELKARPFVSGRHISVISLTESAIFRAAILVEKLKCDGMHFEQAAHFRDKFKMRERYQDLGIPSVIYQCVTRVEDIEYYREKTDSIGIMKPRLGSGSRSTFLVDSKMSFDEIRRKMDLSFSGWIIEEFIPGHAFHVDGYQIDKNIIFSCVSKYISPPYRFKDMRPGGSYVLENEEIKGSMIKTFAQRMIKAMPCPKFSPFHLDVFEAFDGRLLAGEIAMRCAGNRIAETIVAAGGPKINENVLKIVSGQKYEVTRTSGYAGWASVRKRPLALDLKRLPSPFTWMRGLELNSERANQHGEPTSSVDTIASFIAVGSSSLEVQARLREGLRWLVTEVIRPREQAETAVATVHRDE